MKCKKCLSSNLEVLNKTETNILLRLLIGFAAFSTLGMFLGIIGVIIGIMSFIVILFGSKETSYRCKDCGEIFIIK